ncbi:MAG TPA: PAS domain S-box protein [Flavisolibacter sp.]|jgi:PAS domain S-box-containing protein|nr:PAS domain S-box protein [Flavisolibacter sp.]
MISDQNASASASKTHPSLLESDTLRFALDAADIGTWDLNPVTNTFSCNRKTREIFGLNQEEDINLEKAISVMLPGDRNRVAEAIRKALEPGSLGKYEIEYSVVQPQSGEERFVLARGKAYFTEEGQPFRFTGILQDITTERDNRRQQSILQQLVSNSKDSMAMASLDGHMLFLNKAGRKLYGIDPEADITTFTIPEFYSAEQFQLVQKVVVPALQAREYWSGFVKIRNFQTQEEIPCFGDYRLIRDPETGQIISRAQTLRDLRPELSARKELEESESRFRNLVQQAPVATAIYIGPEMTIQWANDAMIKLWGKDTSVIGKTIRQALPELEGQPFHDRLDKVYETGILYQASEDKGEIEVDGQLQTFFFNYSYKPLRDADGKIYGILNMAIDVTEQVKVAKRLEESDKNFRNLIMQAPVGICLLTGENFLVDVANEAYLELVGKSADTFVGRPLWDVLPEARDQGFDQLLNQVRTSGEPYFGNEHQVSLVRNGVTELLYINFVYEPLKDELGQVSGILVIAIDTTLQVQARQHVENAEERARLAIEAARLGTYEVNMTTGAIVASPRFNELFEREHTGSQEDYIASYHPDDLPVRQLAMDQAMKEGVLQYEARVIRKDQSILWLNVMGQLYFDAEGKPVKLVGIIQDITAQKNSDEEREKFLSLSHYSRDFIGMADLSFKPIYLNRAGRSMLGLENTELTNIQLLDCFFPEDREVIKNSFFTKVMQDGYGETEIRFRHFETGEPIWVIYSVFLIRNNKGEPSVIATVSRDITERKSMEQELERRVKERTLELQKVNNELQQFIYISSHDLQEPLRKIQIFSSMLYENLELDYKRSSLYAEKIAASANRVSLLIKNILEFTQLDHSSEKIAAIDLNVIMENVRTDFELLLSEKSGSVTWDPLPVMEGIPFQINQLFYNLVSNALKFSNPDVSPVIHITSSEATTSDMQKLGHILPGVIYFKIDVKDNGIGFNQDFADKIFEIFQRLNNSVDYKGTGIGLAICRKIVAAHDGAIYATSKEAIGSTFTLILPQRKSVIKNEAQTLPE